jgi:hypothetical protein
MPSHHRRMDRFVPRDDERADAMTSELMRFRGWTFAEFPQVFRMCIYKKLNT